MSDHFPCGTPKPASADAAPSNRPTDPMPLSAEQIMGPPLKLRSVADIANAEELLRDCMSRFGGGYVSRIFQILDRVISEGIPLIVSVAGPIGVSGQDRAWLIPLLETGWIAALSVTDAICYHDGHFALSKDGTNPIHEVAIEGKDREYREAQVIRVTDAGFKEQILFDQDRMISAILRQPEFQKRMTGTEFRFQLGKYYAAEERRSKVSPGLFATCHRLAIPVFVGAPGDGSAMLNSAKMWMMSQLGHLEHKFELDVHAEIAEFAAYHYWGLNNGPKKLAVLILGGGVPKNYALQPEPFLSQILGLEARGYDFDVQIVSAPVTDGSLSSCKANEAHTWGKVTAESLEQNVESFQGDYSTVMPLIAWALLNKRSRWLSTQQPRDERMVAERKHYVTFNHHRLFDQRDDLVRTLFDAVAAKKDDLLGSLDYKLALLEHDNPSLPPELKGM